MLALDTPSGLDVTSGEPATPCVRADPTVTVALAKTGLLRAPDHVGDLYLAHISVPASVYASGAQGASASCGGGPSLGAVTPVSDTAAAGISPGEVENEKVSGD